MGYVELQVTSNFSFLRGASHPDELVLTAAALGHSAISIADRNTLAGVVRAHNAAKQVGIRLVVGARLDFADDTPSLLCFPTDRAAYGRLARLLTLGKRRAPKDECHIGWDDLVAHAEGQVVVALAPDCSQVPPSAVTPAKARVQKGSAPALDVRFRGHDAMPSHLHRLRAVFGDRLYLAAQHFLGADDAARLEALAALAEETGVPLVATNDVHYHAPERRALQDALTCIREGCTIDAAGWRLFPNAERHLKTAEAMARLFARFPEAVARTLEIAERCRFSLDELRYEYPIDPVADGETPQTRLERLALAGAAGRYPDGVPAPVQAQIRHELALIAELDFAPYFLTVHDIVRFARSRGILCQGRGSAANSAVCYALGITAVDPARTDLLFERFVSAARGEPPDIDVDFEHERREEVIQYVYAKYGREHAGIAATVITYRSRSALRDVGKALGLSVDTVGALAGQVWGHSRDPVTRAQVRGLGMDPDAPRLRLALDLADAIKGFPRHLSQHVGGFVVTRSRLDEVVPVANAAMAERTVIEWDKDDLDALGMLKIDILALGMLTCIRKCLDLVARHHGRRLTLATVPAEDPAVYDMLCRGDSLGVFQVESRAQMSMLPRLKPRTFYDLVIEVAIVRPGPIQGDMVHPYLRRRAGLEPVSFPSEAMRKVLGKTLGVPLFQEQAMRIAIEGAGFTPAEADRLRKAMATFRRAGLIHQFREKFMRGMSKNSYEADFAKRCFDQIEGFGEYGFPESHAASFALLVYVSAWLKRHYPAAFACALLNSQPMGFYAPAQIVRDAREHGVEARPVDVNFSDWDCTLEASALRLGFRQVKGVPEVEARRIAELRGSGFGDIERMWRRVRGQVSLATLDRLAKADAFASLGLNRREAVWAVRGLRAGPALPLFAARRTAEAGAEPAVAFPEPRPGEQVLADYDLLRLTLRDHPLALMREALAGEGVLPARALADPRTRGTVRVAGLVTCRQRPGTASGVIFLTAEDESATANIIVWPQVFEAHRTAVLRASLVVAEGPVQREGLVVHLIARRIEDHTRRLAALAPEATPPYARSTITRIPSRDFH